MPKSPIRIFISHAHKDQQIAEALIDYLLDEFELKKQEIRCTSVPGFMIPPGQFIASKIRDDLNEGMGLIALLSHFGSESLWVKFELGAAWAKENPVLPIIGPGYLIFGPGYSAEEKYLGPIAHMPCVHINKDRCQDVLLGHLDQMCEELGIKRKNSNTGLAKLQSFMNIYQQWGGGGADFSAAKAKIISPQSNQTVNRNLIIELELSGVPAEGFVWIAIRDKNTKLLWPKEKLTRPQRDGKHTIEMSENGNPEPGNLEICVIGVGTAGDDRLEFWLETAESTGSWPGLKLEEIPVNPVILDCIVGLSLASRV